MKELDGLFDAFEKRTENQSPNQKRDGVDYDERRIEGQKVLKQQVLPVLIDAEKTISNKGYVAALEDKIDHWDVPYVKIGFEALKVDNTDNANPRSFLSFFYLDEHVIQVSRTSYLNCFSDVSETIMPLQMYNKELVRDLVIDFVRRILESTK